MPANLQHGLAEALGAAGGQGGSQPGSHSPERAVQVGAVDEAELGVSPVQLLLLQVDGQPVGPVDVRVHNDLPGAAVHARPLDAGCLTPVCPVHVPKGGRGGDRGKRSALRFVSCLYKCKRETESECAPKTQPAETATLRAWPVITSDWCSKQ